MPYLHLDLPRTYSTAVKRDLATPLQALRRGHANSIVAAKRRYR